LLSEGYSVKCMSVNYGQKHSCELDAAKNLTKRLNIEHKTLDIRTARSLLGDNALTSENTLIPKGHYCSENMKSTIVPNRNMIFLSFAIAWAISTKSSSIAYAAHAGDHTIYPDCRTEFIESMRTAASLCDWNPIDIMTPFSNKTKTDIVKLGAELNVPFEHTWSCYVGSKVHCGECGTCVERKEAFRLAGICDPTRYKD